MTNRAIQIPNAPPLRRARFGQAPTIAMPDLSLPAPRALMEHRGKGPDRGKEHRIEDNENQQLPPFA